MQNVQTLKGFRDFLPQEKKVRNFVENTITETFEVFGFQPIQTPTLEYASLLLGKYGSEADKLVYSFEDQGGRKIALRYDQTVPTTRVLSQYQNELPKYFRRYQIQSVFRADKPQKGRFREFTQCDCDIFESNSTIVDAELLAVYYTVYQNLGLQSIQLLVNDRTTLIETISQFSTETVSVTTIIQAIDKLDKLSTQAVVLELVKKGLSEANAQAVLEKITTVQMSETLQKTVEQAVALGVNKDAIIFTPTLARGLDYYTGMIFEGKIPEYSGGSVGGGGRYDNLIGELCGRDVQASGFAIGFDRTVEAVVELGLVAETTKNSSQVLVTLFDDSLTLESLRIAKILRDNKIKTEVYPVADKIGKQLKLANQKNIPFVVMLGADEVSQEKVKLKNMISGEQELLSVADLIKTIRN